jgi:hypothetical protein
MHRLGFMYAQIWIYVCIDLDLTMNRFLIYLCIDLDLSMHRFGFMYAQIWIYVCIDLAGFFFPNLGIVSQLVPFSSSHAAALPRKGTKLLLLREQLENITWAISAPPHPPAMGLNEP